MENKSTKDSTIKELNTIPEGFSESDVKKINTLVALHKEIQLVGSSESKEQTISSAKKIDALLEGYTSEEISQFALCIAGKRATLPGTDIVFMIQNDESTTNSNKKKNRP